MLTVLQKINIPVITTKLLSAYQTWAYRVQSLQIRPQAFCRCPCQSFQIEFHHGLTEKYCKYLGFTTLYDSIKADWLPETTGRHGCLFYFKEILSRNGWKTGIKLGKKLQNLKMYVLEIYGKRLLHTPIIPLQAWHILFNLS